MSDLAPAVVEPDYYPPAPDAEYGHCRIGIPGHGAAITVYGGEELAKQRALRIAACLEACAGIPTEKLSDGCVLKLGTEQELAVIAAERARDALVEALRKIDSKASALGASGVPTMVAAALKSIGVPRFANVFCSQCGQDFGPGDAGYSDCRDHAEKVPV